MLLQTFTDHFGGLAHFEVTVLLHFGFQTGYFRFVGFLQSLLPDLGSLFFQPDLIPQGDDLGFLLLDGGLHRQLFPGIGGTGALLQAKNFLIFLKQIPLTGGGKVRQLPVTGSGKLRQLLFTGGVHLPAERGGTGRKLLIKLFIANLGNDGGIARFIHLKYLPAIGAFDLVHQNPPGRNPA